MHPRANLLARRTKIRASPPQQDKNKLSTTNPSPFHSLFSKMVVDRQPYIHPTFQCAADRYYKFSHRKYRRKNCDSIGSGRLELVCAQKRNPQKILSKSQQQQQQHETQTLIISIIQFLPSLTYSPAASTKIKKILSTTRGQKLSAADPSPLPLSKMAPDSRTTRRIQTWIARMHKNYTVSEDGEFAAAWNW